MSDDDSNRPAPDLPSLSIGPHFEMHPVVFPAGAIIVLSLVAISFLLPGENLESTFVGVRNWIGATFGWMYVAAMTGFLIFAVWLAASRYGKIRLGRDDEKPEFNRLTWFAMLFSAGMGIGLLFWSVAEPINHFTTQPPGFADGLNPARVAMAALSLDPAKYEALHDALMGHRGEMGEDVVMAMAADAGLDAAALRQAMADPAIAENIRATYALAQQLRIEGTPSFVIGDRIVRGFVQLDQMRELVALARSEAG